MHDEHRGRETVCLVSSDSAIRGSHRIPAYSVVKAGVVEIMQRQQQGWAYIRP